MLRVSFPLGLSLRGPVRREETKTVWSLSRLPGSIVRLTASDLSFSAGAYHPKG